MVYVQDVQCKGTWHICFTGESDAIVMYLGAVCILFAQCDSGRGGRVQMSVCVDWSTHRKKKRN